jgi:hypothetical protein
MPHKSMEDLEFLPKLVSQYSFYEKEKVSNSENNTEASDDEEKV